MNPDNNNEKEKLKFYAILFLNYLEINLIILKNKKCPK